MFHYIFEYLYAYITLYINMSMIAILRPISYFLLNIQQSSWLSYIPWLGDDISNNTIVHLSHVWNTSTSYYRWTNIAGTASFWEIFVNWYTVMLILGKYFIYKVIVITVWSCYIKLSMIIYRLQNMHLLFVWVLSCV